MEWVDKSTIISWVCLFSRVTTEARRGGRDLVVDLEFHERTVDFLGSSNPTYLNVSFWEGYEF